MNEKPNIDLEKNNHKAALEYNCQMKTDGNNLIVVYNSESNAFGAMSLGQINFNKCSDGDLMSQVYDVQDFGLFNNKTICCISKLTQESIQIEKFTSGDSKPKTYTIKETTIMKFHYPAVMMIKGCNEILIYSITENLYYYIKLNSPILFESSTICSVYGLELK